MPQFLGRATIRVNGSVIETTKGAKLSVGGVKRNKIISGRLVGYAEETVEATVECDTALRAGMSIDALRRVAGATIIFECDTGQRYVIGDAFITEPPLMQDGDSSKVTLKFAGPAAEEVL